MTKETSPTSARRPLLILAGLAAVLFTGNATTGWFAYDRHLRLAVVEQESQELSQERRSLAEELAARRAAEEQLDRELKGTREREQTLTVSVADLRREATKLGEDCQQLEVQRARLEGLRAELEEQLLDSQQSQAELKRRLDELGESYTKLQGDFEQNEDRLKRSLGAIKDLETSLDDFKGILARLQKDGINVMRRVGRTKAPELNATVIHLETSAMPPELLLDVGSDHKVEIDELFYITRGGTFIGTARVSSLTKEKSVARVTKTAANQRVQQGDHATTRPPAGT